MASDGSVRSRVRAAWRENLGAAKLHQTVQFAAASSSKNIRRSGVCRSESELHTPSITQLDDNVSRAEGRSGTAALGGDQPWKSPLRGRTRREPTGPEVEQVKSAGGRDVSSERGIFLPRHVFPVASSVELRGRAVTRGFRADLTTFPSPFLTATLNHLQVCRCRPLWFAIVFGVDWCSVRHRWRPTYCPRSARCTA